MRVAILGGRGVVGGYLARTLSQKHDVASITRTTFDLFDYHAMQNYFDKHAFDVVINAAVNPDSQMTASTQVAADNLTIFTNIYACRYSFGRMLQLCSGAEFDRRRSLDNIGEDSLFESMPIDPYGISKNACAKISALTDAFFNLRLFGVFFATEASTRLLPKILSGQDVVLTDKYFDYLYLEDLLPLVEYYVETSDPLYKDINAVYSEKILLSEFVKKFCEVQNLSGENVSFGDKSNLNYTGDGSKLASLDLPSLGIITGMKRYR